MKKQINTVDLTDFISAMSLALDLAEATAFREYSHYVDFDAVVPEFSKYSHNFAYHSRKTALISYYIAEKMALDNLQMEDLFISSFLHDIGAVNAFSLSHTNRSFISDHSEFGAQITRSMLLSEEISRYIKYHHENHDGSGPFGLNGSEIPLASAVIHAADIFELMYDDKVPNRLQRDKICGWFKAKRSLLFSPEVVDALLEAIQEERFWLDIENIHIDQSVLKRISPKADKVLTLADIQSLSQVFSAIIDKKSRFTQTHSTGLAKHAANFALYYHFDSEKQIKIQIAALLHDLGKLVIPNEILDKPDKLTAEEFIIMKSHTYYTKLILNKIIGMSEIAEWAGNHHETLCGNGYPERLGDTDLSLECRILSVCDVYQALTEERPYRGGMSTREAFNIINNMVSANHLDPKVAKDLNQIL